MVKKSKGVENYTARKNPDGSYGENIQGGVEP
jgi:hypothetical protein